MEKDSNTCNTDNVVVDVAGNAGNCDDKTPGFKDNENGKHTLNREGVEQSVVMVRLLLKFSEI